MNEKDLISVSNTIRYEVIKILIERYKDITLSNLDIIEQVADDILTVLNRVGDREEVKEMLK
jgi:hypothetical protein